MANFGQSAKGGQFLKIDTTIAMKQQELAE